MGEVIWCECIVKVISCEVKVEGGVFLEQRAHFWGDGVCLEVCCEVGIRDGEEGVCAGFLVV